MNERPAPLKIDFEQWRKDIETFVTETEQELQQIIAELSGEEPQSRPSGNQTMPATTASAASNDNQRLASLREKLAQRINGPND